MHALGFKTVPSRTHRGGTAYIRYFGPRGHNIGCIIRAASCPSLLDQGTGCGKCKKVKTVTHIFHYKKDLAVTLQGTLTMGPMSIFLLFPCWSFQTWWSTWKGLGQVSHGLGDCVGHLVHGWETESQTGNWVRWFMVCLSPPLPRITHTSENFTFPTRSVKFER